VPGPDAFAPMRVDRVLGGRYRLIRPIAKGGMAEVWEGYDDILSRPVAIKILHPHLATDSNLVERFRREAISAARLSHPGVVATYDTGSDNGTAFIVMELVRGHTLRQLLTERGPMDPPMAVDVAGQIADALAHAHRAGLVHRDIKPANVLLVEDDSGPPRAKVTDFGIAKATEGMGLDLTRTGMVLGTPKYLSPEQVEGEEPDARADLYSLGVVLFEMLTCRVPFEGPTDMATAVAHVRQQPPRVSSLRPDLPPELDQLVADLLAKDPAARVPSAAALRQALARLPLWPGESHTPNGTRTPFSVSPPPPPPPDGRVYAPRPAVGPGRATTDSPVPSPNGFSPVPPPNGFSPVPGTPSPSETPSPNGNPAPIGSLAAARGMAPANALNGGVGRGAALNGSDLFGAAATGQGFGPPGSEGVTRLGSPSASATGVLVPDAPRVVPKPPRRRRIRRRHWLPGLSVSALLVAGAVVAYVLLSDNPGRAQNKTPPSTSATGSGTVTSPTPIAIQNVQIWMDSQGVGHSLDNPDQTKLTFDGNPNTLWSTDQYNTSTFGGFYSGEGLAIHLVGNHTLHTLTVTSPTQGWAAETYVAKSLPAFESSSVSSWGAPTDRKSGINGSATFNLSGRSGSWVLFWLTNLGPNKEAQVAEFKVT
jgi:serine/threonine protein kinase